MNLQSCSNHHRWLLLFAGDPPFLVDLRTVPIGNLSIAISAQIGGALQMDTVVVTSKP